MDLKDNNEISDLGILGPKFFWTKICVVWKFFWDKIILGPKIFGPAIFLPYFLSQAFSAPTNSSKCPCQTINRLIQKLHITGSRHCRNGVTSGSRNHRNCWQIDSERNVYHLQLWDHHQTRILHFLSSLQEFLYLWSGQSWWLFVQTLFRKK